MEFLTYPKGENNENLVVRLGDYELEVKNYKETSNETFGRLLEGLTNFYTKTRDDHYKFLEEASKLIA